PPDDRGPPNRGAFERHAQLDDDASLDPGVDELALDPLVEVVQDQAVGVEHVLHLTRVLPPAADDVRVDGPSAVDEPLDRIGYLELPAPRGLDRPRRVEDRRGEHVDADERKV